jgi:hypothetical protein
MSIKIKSILFPPWFFTAATAAMPPSTALTLAPYRDSIDVATFLLTILSSTYGKFQYRREKMRYT